MADPAAKVPAPPPKPPDRLPRPEKPKPKTPPHTSSGNKTEKQPAPPLEQPSPTGGPGSKLPPPVGEQISKSLGVDTSGVRVHTDARAAQTTQMLGARALTVGPHIFLGKGERPTDTRLMAHETAHAVQQRSAPRVQLWTQSSSDRFEHEANRASSAVVSHQSFRVTERTTPRVQRFGISDLLDWFADKANYIPGYRMFTVIIGVNPINGAKVERSGANILRAAVEFIPGGHLIVEALEKYGIFEKGGKWLEQQVATLGMAGSMFIDALKEFIDSLGWTDIFHPGRVWERAKDIFLRPIRKLIEFFVGVAVGILKLIKEAILKPLAKLAEGTEAWDLILQVLGENPITGEPVPRSADKLIGGFMKLIGQEEIWNNIKKANAISRAFAWFQGALAGVLAFVRQIPKLFIDALKSLEISDIVLLPKAFVKVGKVFLGFAGKFFSWALQQVLSLLQIIFEVVAPGAVPYIAKAKGAFNEIIKNPAKFIGNLVRAGKAGFDNFRKNFLAHLRKSIIDWLTGSMAGANIYIPQAFELKEIIKFVLSVFGLTWDNIRAKLVKAIGEPAVKALEIGFDIVLTLVKEGPAAAWEKIKEHLSNLKEMVMGMILDMVKSTIIEIAITKILSFLSPVGAFIQAIIAIYNTIMFFIERLKTIAQVVGSFIDSISAIAAGNIGSAAARVESTMAGLLTLVISFLARFIGLGKVSDKVKDIIQKIRAPIDKALDKVIEWIVTMAKKIGKFFMGKAAPGKTEHDERFAAAARAVNEDLDRMKAAGLKDEDMKAAIPRWKGAHRFSELELKEVDGNWEVFGSMSPDKKRVASAAEPGSKKRPFGLKWPKPRTSAYPDIFLGGVIGARRTQEYLEDMEGQKDSTGTVVQRYSPERRIKVASGETIGLGTKWRMTLNKVVGPLSEATTPGGEKLNSILRKCGFRPKKEDLQADHAHEIQLGGEDAVENLWPLETSKNTAAGAKLGGAEITYPDSGKTAKVKDLKKAAREYWFKITAF